MNCRVMLRDDTPGQKLLRFITKKENKRDYYVKYRGKEEDMEKKKRLITYKNKKEKRNKSEKLQEIYLSLIHI